MKTCVERSVRLANITSADTYRREKKFYKPGKKGAGVLKELFKISKPVLASPSRITRKFLKKGAAGKGKKRRRNAEERI